MFTQLCSDDRMDFARQTGSSSDAEKPTIGLEKNVIYNSMSMSCAAACVRAAVELVSHVHATYKTSLTDAWWYNGFCMFSHWPYPTKHFHLMCESQIHRLQDLF